MKNLLTKKQSRWYHRNDGIKLNTLKPATHATAAIIWLVTLILVAVTWHVEQVDKRELVKTAYATEEVAGKSAELEPTIAPKDIDIYTGLAVDEFFTTPGQQSEMRMIMHCLLKRETSHGYNKGHGDQGKAGGPLQFWQGTWEGYRKLMIKEGLATEIGSRYDLKEAIRTTVWAIKNDRAKAWGPIYRALNGRTDNTCPIPSWY